MNILFSCSIENQKFFSSLLLSLSLSLHTHFQLFSVRFGPRNVLKVVAKKVKGEGKLFNEAMLSLNLFSVFLYFLN